MSSGSSRPSLIDKIFITSLNFDAGSGNLIHKITDHMPNFVTLKRKIIKNYKTKSMKYYFCDLKKTLSNIYEAFILPYINHCTLFGVGFVLQYFALEVKALRRLRGLYSSKKTKCTL